MSQSAHCGQCRCGVRLSRIPIYSTSTSLLYIHLSIYIRLTWPRALFSPGAPKTSSTVFQHGETGVNPILSTTSKYHTTSSHTSLGGSPPPSAASPWSATLSRPQIIGISLPQPPIRVSFLSLSQILGSWTPSFAVVWHGLITTNFEPSPTLPFSLCYTSVLRPALLFIHLCITSLVMHFNLIPRTPRAFILVGRCLGKIAMASANCGEGFRSVQISRYCLWMGRGSDTHHWK